MDQDGGHEDSDVDQIHTVREAEERVFQRKPEPLLFVDLSELGRDGLLRFLADNLEARRQRMARSGGPREQVDRLGEVLLERLEPSVALDLQIDDGEIGAEGSGP